MLQYEELEPYRCPGDHTVVDEPSLSGLFDSKRRFSLRCDGVEYAGRTFDLKTKGRSELGRWENWENNAHMIDWLILVVEKLKSEKYLLVDENSNLEEQLALCEGGQ